MMKNFGVKIIWKLEFWIKFIWKLELWKLMFEIINEELRKQGHEFLFYFIFIFFLNSLPKGCHEQLCMSGVE